jgi:hypothetical protein
VTNKVAFGLQKMDQDLEDGVTIKSHRLMEPGS